MRRKVPAVEITTPLDLTLEEESLLDMHSILNVCNVILFELINLESALDGGEELLEAQVEVGAVARSLGNPEAAHRAIERIDSFIAFLEEALGSAVARKREKGESAAVVESRANLESIFDILRVRAREIAARSLDPDGWVRHDINQLRNNFLNLFRAIEQNSRGGYRIVYNLAQHEEGDYYVNLQISSADGETIRMPAVFQDVMRDLIANARKYTDPGGRIEAALYGGGQGLNFVVEDSGRGMNPEALSDLIDFGVRGENVPDRPTRGGGFGLTKAYYVTRKFRGRMWIATEIGSGSRIEIRIPYPESPL
ncbi:MAG: ATP-binding protein [Alkalispirochaetaceae bacterium]